VLQKRERRSLDLPRKNRRLQQLLRAVRQKPIFRKILEACLSEKSPRKGILKEGPGSKRFVFWIKSRAQSFRHAGRGIYLLWLTQWNFRIHLLAGLGAVGLGCFFRLSAVEWMVLMAVIFLVLSAEAFNTAIERAVDLLEPRKHSVARDAKDLAAAAVLIASFCSLIVGLILFGPRFWRLLLG
jgi:diacylglycerol kinase (ATP)